METDNTCAGDICYSRRNYITDNSHEQTVKENFSQIKFYIRFQKKGSKEIDRIFGEKNQFKQTKQDNID